MTWQLCDDCGGKRGMNVWESGRKVFRACETCGGLGQVQKSAWGFVVTIALSLGMWIVLGLAARGAWDLLHWVGSR